MYNLLLMAYIPSPGIWADPGVWIVVAVVLVILTIVLIYYKVFTAEESP
jgi:hypothetical protein